MAPRASENRRTTASYKAGEGSIPHLNPFPLRTRFDHVGHGLAGSGFRFARGSERAVNREVVRSGHQQLVGGGSG